jgi:hypothetical protein
MSRGQENQVFNTSSDQNKTAATNAQTSYNAAQTDIGNYQDQLSKFASANPYGQGGEYQTATNQATSNTADAASQAAAQQMQSQAVRTGQNAAGGIAAGLQANQTNTRNLMEQQAKNNASRISSGADYGKSVLSASEVPATLEAGLTGQQLNAQSSTLSDEEKAAQTPSVMDELTRGLISAGSSFAAAYCPAKGSLYLMHDGSEKPVEHLKAGELLMGIDGEADEIDFIESVWTLVVKVTTENGLVARNSRSHTYARPMGGFVVASRALGVMILTATGPSKVVSVEPDGADDVFNVVSKRSHTYCVDGMWALGNGDDEYPNSTERLSRMAEMEAHNGVR